MILRQFAIELVSQLSLRNLHDSDMNDMYLCAFDNVDWGFNCSGTTKRCSRAKSEHLFVTLTVQSFVERLSCLCSSPSPPEKVKKKRALQVQALRKVFVTAVSLINPSSLAHV